MRSGVDHLDTRTAARVGFPHFFFYNKSLEIAGGEPCLTTVNMPSSFPAYPQQAFAQSGTKYAPMVPMVNVTRRVLATYRWTSLPPLDVAVNIRHLASDAERHLL